VNSKPIEILKEALYRINKEFGIAVESLDVCWLYSLDGSATILDMKIEGGLK
jgi:hypothetical protein